MTSSSADRAALSTSNAIKVPCKAATTANITLSGTQTIDGVAITAGDRVLVRSQSTASQNGIYIASATAWTRAPDFDGPRDIAEGTLVYITHGTAYAQTMWAVTTSDPVIGSTSIAFAQLAAISTGTYLPISGGTLTGAVTGTSLTLSGALVADDATFTGDLTGATADFSGTLEAASLNVTGSTPPAAGLYLPTTNTAAISSRSLPVSRFTNPASAVNYWQFNGAATGDGVQLLAASDTDANVDTVFCTKGSGTHRFLTNGAASDQFRIAHVANSVNYWQVYGAAAGNSPQLRIFGNDTNIGAIFSTKGSGGYRFLTDDTNAEHLRIAHTASAVNYLSITGSASSAGTATLAAAGNDTNISIVIAPKGTANVQIGSSTSHGMVIGTGALATNATSGFLQIPSSAGAATGAVTAAYSGAVCLHYDSTNNKLMVRSGGTWRATGALT